MLCRRRIWLLTLGPAAEGKALLYKSREGIDLTFENVRFPSPEDAKEAFHHTLNAADRIGWREVLYDRSGQRVVGERVVILYHTERGASAAAVVSLSDNRLYWFASTSLRHALFFERSHRLY
jgi:hypothetical protein